MYIHFTEVVLYSLENFLLQKFTFITDATRGWKLGHENFIHKKLLLSRIWQNCEIFIP